MNGMKSWMLGAAVVAGAMGMATGTAQAAEFGVYVRGPVAYAPPCPGAGYVWIAGYQAEGYWVPGRWAFGGVRGPVRFEEDRVAQFDRGHDLRFDRGHERFRR
jgi:hypothetical protein